jgi:hypothetical protein
MADRDGGTWRSPAADSIGRPQHVRSVAILRNGDSLDVAWISVSTDGGGRIMVAPSLISCCE